MKAKVIKNNGCIHHWVIDAKGKGVCKKCPAVKQFPEWKESFKTIDVRDYGS